MLPNEITGLWGIELNKYANKDEHIKYVTNRNLSKSRLNDLMKLFDN